MQKVITGKKGVSLFTILTVIVIVCAGALIGLYSYSQASRAQRINDRCLEAVTPIQLALRQWSADHIESHLGYDVFPETLQDLVRQGYLEELPLNPFGEGQMRELQLGDSNEIGCVRYIPCESVYKLDNGQTVREKNYYYLIVYTPENIQPSQETAQQLERFGPGNLWWTGAWQGYRNYESNRTIELQGKIHSAEWIGPDNIDSQLKSALDQLGI